MTLEEFEEEIFYLTYFLKQTDREVMSWPSKKRRLRAEQTIELMKAMKKAMEE